MQKLTDAFPEDETVQKLYILTRCFSPYIPASEQHRQLFIEKFNSMDVSERPDWSVYFLDTEKTWTLSEIFNDLKLNLDTRRSVWKSLLPWLNRVLYQTSAFLPHITEEAAYNLALGHPVSLWLFENADLLDAACSIGMFVYGGKLELCAPLIRLPQLVIRFRMILAPVINGFHTKSIEELKELRPLYFDLA